MRITLNGTALVVNEYDNEDTILARYSLVKEGSLPSYFRITDKVFALEENGKLHVEDVRSEISKLRESDLADKYLMTSIWRKYPKLNLQLLGLLWILGPGKGKIPKELDFLQQLDRMAFITDVKVKMELKELSDKITKESLAIAKRIKDLDDVYASLKKIKSTEVSPLAIENITDYTILNLPNQETLIDVFDAFDVSDFLPFIHFRSSSITSTYKELFKVYSRFQVPDSWLNSEDEIFEPHILLYVLDAGNYTQVLWANDNTIRITHLASSKINADDIVSQLGDRVKVEISQTRQISVRTTFSIPPIQEYIFSDMVMTNEILSKFLFFNERNQTVTSKRRYYMYFSPLQNGTISTSQSIMVTTEADGTILRIMRAASPHEAEVCRKIMSKLLTIYLENKEKVSEIYADLLPDVSLERSKETKKKKKGETEDKRKNPRLVALRKTHPQIFGHPQYSTVCQSTRQPKILTKREAEKLDANKVLNYPAGSDTWYTCDPREPEDKDQTQIFPGLQVNEAKRKMGNVREQIPYIPCCFNQDQYKKKSSGLKTYLASLQGIGSKQTKAKEVPEKKVRGIGNIVGSGKILSPGQYGDLPYMWFGLLKEADYTTFSQGEYVKYPVVRYLPFDSPDSFLHCMEQAFHSEIYSNLTIEKKAERIKQIRLSLKNENFALAKQELFGYTDQDIRNILDNDNSFIDPRLFVSLVEKKYKCNILLLRRDKDYPDGTIQLPRYSQAYLFPVLDTSKPFVVIFMDQTQGTNYPYHCEILSEIHIINSKPKTATYIFQQSKLINILLGLFYNSNIVYVADTHEDTLSYNLYLPLKD